MSPFRPLLLPTVALALLACGDDGTNPTPDGEIRRIDVTPAVRQTAWLDDEFAFTAAARDGAGNPVPDAAFVWSSSDEGVATVDAGGRATTTGFGATEIRATADGVTGTARVTVTGEQSLDFLVGRWTVGGTFHDGAGAHAVEGVAEVVEYEGGRVLVETVRVSVETLREVELSSLHATLSSGSWATVRADGTRGANVTMIGAFDQGDVVFDSGDRLGSGHRERTMLDDFREGSFEWSVAISSDGGTTWTPVWDLTWTRSSRGLAEAPDPALACTSPPHGAFDYWVGQWDVTSGGAPSGTNEVEVVAGGCAIRENWRGTDGSIGVSLTGFDARRAEWEQIYFDSGGGTLDLRGSVRDGVMTLTQQSPGGLDRFRWIPLGDDQVRQLWENSGDGGGTWSTVFDGLYRRR